MNLIEMKHIQKAFLPESPVLKDISLTVRQGEVLAVIGASGSGKSTLLRCATQLETIDSGEIVICGKTLVHTEQKISRSGKSIPTAVYAGKEERKQILECTGLVFQSFHLFPHYNVLRNVMDAPVRVLKQSKEEAANSAMELLEKMNLADRAKAYPSELSGGQQQRVSIARALAMKPKVLFFDEPTSALDPELTVEILRVLRNLRTAGHTMVIVTHEMEFARNIADRVIYMREGIIEVEGTPAEVFGKADNPYLNQFLNSGKSELQP